MINNNSRKIAFSIIFIKLAGVFFATKIFASFTPLVDSELYLRNFFSESAEFRTQIVSLTAGYLNSIIGSFMTHFIFGLFSVIGLFIRLNSGKSILGLIPFLLLPSTLVWNSVTGKEAVFTAFFVTALVIWAEYITRRLTKAEMFLVLVCFISCSLLRPHYSVVLPWMFFSLFVVKNVHRGSLSIILGSFSCLVYAIYHLAWRPLMIRAYQMVDASGRSSRHESLGMLSGDSVKIFEYNFIIFTDAIPFGAVFGILGPSPEEVFNRLLLAPFAIEGLIVFLLPLIIYYFSVKFLRSKDKIGRFTKIFCFCVAPSIALVIWLHSPFGVLNPGSAIRWRTNFETLFYFAPMLLFMEVRGRKS